MIEEKLAETTAAKDDSVDMTASFGMFTSAVPRQRKTAKLSDEELKKDIEDDLVNEFGRMKHLARHLREQLVKDNQIVSKLNENITSNIKGTEQHTKSLDAFLKMSNELGFMRLLFMGLTAIALFVITVFFIFFTSFFR